MRMERYLKTYVATRTGQYKHPPCVKNRFTAVEEKHTIAYRGLPPLLSSEDPNAWTSYNIRELHTGAVASYLDEQ